MSVFDKGISQGLEGLMLVGGRIAPISTEGDELEWKNAQKKAARNITSVVMDGIIP